MKCGVVCVMVFMICSFMDKIGMCCVKSMSFCVWLFLWSKIFVICLILCLVSLMLVIWVFLG